MSSVMIIDYYCPVATVPVHYVLKKDEPTFLLELCRCFIELCINYCLTSYSVVKKKLIMPRTCNG